MGAMAFVPLHPVGSPRERFLDSAEIQQHAEAMEQRLSTLRERREVVRAGWGEKYVERTHAKGKMTAWERVEALKDPGAPVHAVGTFVNWGVEYDQGGKKMVSPGAGVITVLTKVEGRWVVVIANDNTVASGSWWPQSPEKIERAQEIGLSLKIPVVYLVDCSGLFLPEQSRSFPGRYRRRAHLQEERPALGRGRAADRRRVRRLHRRRRLHADHLRSGST